jgi:type VI secretion system secreted protein VgrG
MGRGGAMAERGGRHPRTTLRAPALSVTSSLGVGDVFGETVGSYSVMAVGPNAGTIHLVAGVPPRGGGQIVMEAGVDVTLNAPGGFVKVDSGGVTIVGTLVLINESGGPGSLPPPGAAPPEPAQRAEVVAPTLPEPDGSQIVTLAREYASWALLLAREAAST